MSRLLSLFFTCLLVTGLNGQSPEETIKSIFSNALTDGSAERHLYYLCKETKGRLPGSNEALKAVEYTMDALISAGADTVWVQEVPVPHWVRGEEKATIIDDSSETDLTVSALGLSVPTPPGGLLKEVIEVHGFDELGELGNEVINDKIVFFNRPVDNTLLNTFSGYGGAVDQRVNGASEASKYGAAAVIVRSATQADHDFAHTGVLRYSDNTEKIPALSVSPHDADILSTRIKKDNKLKLFLLSTCINLPDTISFNVIGEIRGSEMANHYITVGGHLDAWDVGEGAHDDAGGCVQSIEVIRLFKSLGIEPRRSVRAVMFMNEEMSSTGGQIYAAEAERRGEIHYAALESDRGVLSPMGFTFGAEGERLSNLVSLKSYFKPYNIEQFSRGGGGSDISPLQRLGTLQIGYIPDTQRYFWFHHSANDTFEQVNIREMQLGSAAIASLIYLLDINDY